MTTGEKWKLSVPNGLIVVHKDQLYVLSKTISRIEGSKLIPLHKFDNRPEKIVSLPNHIVAYDKHKLTLTYLTV